MVSTGGRWRWQGPLGVEGVEGCEDGPGRIRIVSSGTSGISGPKRRVISRRNANASIIHINIDVRLMPQKVPLLICQVEGRAEQSRSRRRDPVPVLVRHRLHVPEGIFSIAFPKWQHRPNWKSNGTPSNPQLGPPILQPPGRGPPRGPGTVTAGLATCLAEGEL